MEQIGDEMRPGVSLAEHPCPNLEIRESTGAGAGADLEFARSLSADLE